MTEHTLETRVATFKLIMQIKAETYQKRVAELKAAPEDSATKHLLEYNSAKLEAVEAVMAEIEKHLK
jgi:hypothetical protein